MLFISKFWRELCLLFLAGFGFCAHFYDLDIHKNPTSSTNPSLSISRDTTENKLIEKSQLLNERRTSMKSKTCWNADTLSDQLSLCYNEFQNFINNYYTTDYSNFSKTDNSGSPTSTSLSDSKNTNSLNSRFLYERERQNSDKNSFVKNLIIVGTVVGLLVGFIMLGGTKACKKKEKLYVSDQFLGHDPYKEHDPAFNGFRAGGADPYAGGGGGWHDPNAGGWHEQDWNGGGGGGDWGHANGGDWGQGQGKGQERRGSWAYAAGGEHEEEGRMSGGSGMVLQSGVSGTKLISGETGKAMNPGFIPDGLFTNTNTGNNIITVKGAKGGQGQQGKSSKAVAVVVPPQGIEMNDIIVSGIHPGTEDLHPDDIKKSLPFSTPSANRGLIHDIVPGVSHGAALWRQMVNKDMKGKNRDYWGGRGKGERDSNSIINYMQYNTHHVHGGIDYGGDDLPIPRGTRSGLKGTGTSPALSPVAVSQLSPVGKGSQGAAAAANSPSAAATAGWHEDPNWHGGEHDDHYGGEHHDDQWYAEHPDEHHDANWDHHDANWEHHDDPNWHANWDHHDDPNWHGEEGHDGDWHGVGKSM